MRVHIYGRCATACYSGIFTPFVDFHVSGFSFSFYLSICRCRSLESPAVSILDNVPARGDDTTDSQILALAHLV